MRRADEARELLQNAETQEVAAERRIAKQGRYTSRLRAMMDELNSYGVQHGTLVGTLLRNVSRKLRDARQGCIDARRTLALLRLKRERAMLHYRSCVIEDEVKAWEYESGRGPPSLPGEGAHTTLHAGHLRAGGHVRVGKDVFQVARFERGVRFEEGPTAFVTGEDAVVVYQYFKEVPAWPDLLYTPAVLSETGGYQDPVPPDQLPSEESEMRTSV